MNKLFVMALTLITCNALAMDRPTSPVSPVIREKQKKKKPVTRSTDDSNKESKKFGLRDSLEKIAKLGQTDAILRHLQDQDEDPEVA